MQTCPMSVLIPNVHQYLRSYAAVCYLIRLFSIQEDLQHSNTPSIMLLTHSPQDQKERGESRKGDRNRRSLVGRVKFHRTKACY